MGSSLVIIYLSHIYFICMCVYKRICICFVCVHREKENGETGALPERG